MLDLFLIRTPIALVGDHDVGMAEEIFDEGQVLRAAVELGGDAVAGRDRSRSQSGSFAGGAGGNVYIRCRGRACGRV